MLVASVRRLSQGSSLSEAKHLHMHACRWQEGHTAHATVRSSLRLCRLLLLRPSLLPLLHI